MNSGDSPLIKKRQHNGFGLADTAGDELFFSGLKYIKGQALQL